MSLAHHSPLSLCSYKADLSCLLPLRLNSKGRLKATNWVIKISTLNRRVGLEPQRMSESPLAVLCRPHVTAALAAAPEGTPRESPGPLLDGNLPCPEADPMKRAGNSVEDVHALVGWSAAWHRSLLPNALPWATGQKGRRVFGSC